MPVVKKQRLDKYYNLAKEKGYRARSAFKLLELNRKYSFLNNAHIAVDLCAAPGGWMQILSQEMPTPRKIIGIDLDPIKPLGNDCISFVGDITTKETRKTLISLLDGNQVDVFVHDGAPNFGTSKERDVFVQNDLVLHSLKLATEFLRKGGVFVSKVFRSENFSKIINVFQELFDNVDVTKPMSSRMESAEIFAVCRGFKDPEEINPAYFNSELLFKDETEYKEDYKKIKLSEYIKSTDSSILDTCLSIIPDFECKLIDEEMLEFFKDLKLLSKTDLRKIKKLKISILSQVKKGILKIKELEDLVVADEHDKVSSSEERDKFEEINEKLEKIAKNERKKEEKYSGTIEIPQHRFFEDRIFKDIEITEQLPEENEDDYEVSVESCSESMSMTESEMRCAILLKENEDAFVDGTIDRYLHDSEDLVLPCEKRVIKSDEPKAIPKKKLEYVSRKKARALRRANKVMSEIQVEDEEEEAIIYKKIYKGQYKKQKPKTRLVFPSAGIFQIPKGKGKIRFLDRRMKHDLRIEKSRSKNKK